LSYLPARLHRLVASIPWNLLLGPLKVKKIPSLFSEPDIPHQYSNAFFLSLLFSWVYTGKLYTYKTDTNCLGEDKTLVAPPHLLCFVSSKSTFIIVSTTVSCSPYRKVTTAVEVGQIWLEMTDKN